MKRTLFVCAAFFLAGVYGSGFVPAGLLWFLSVVLLSLLVCVPFLKGARFPFVLLLLFFLGAVRMHIADDVTGRSLYPYVDEYVTVTGQVTEFPKVDEEDGCVTLVAELTELSFLKDIVPLKEKVRLSVSEDDAVPGFGETFRAVCRFSIPDVAMNAGGFHYEHYLKTKKIFFSGYIEKGTVLITGNEPLGLSEQIYLLNQRCKNAIDNLVPGEGAAVLQAIALGNKDAMSETLTKQLQVSGLSHMTAVSGMHVSILISALYTLLGMLRQNRYRYIWLTAGIILFFMLFTGASFSVARATVMGLMVLFAYCFFRKEDPLTSLALAAGLIVAMNPFAGYDIGFLLSFGATLGILLFASPLTDRLTELLRLQNGTGFFNTAMRSFVSVFAVSISAQIFVLPLASYHFGTFSVWSILSNLLAWPLAPVLLVCGLLSSVLGLVHPALGYLPAAFGYPFVKLFLAVVHFFGDRGSGLVTVGAFGVFRLYLYGLLTIGFYQLIHKKPGRCLVPLVSAVLLICISFFGNTGNPVAEITFINVGQGDCTLLSLPGDTHILIDAGGVPEYAGGYDVGGQVVLPYLQKRGIDDLDYMIASHPHADHILGLESLLEKIPVNTLLVPVDFEESEEGRRLLGKAGTAGTDILALCAGDSVSFSEFGSLKVLHPGEGSEFLENENDRSLVLTFAFGTTKALFPGDLESAGENYLIEENSLFDVDILKVGHHGSATSTAETFLMKLDPEYAYIPCGENQYGHPAPEVLERLQNCGAEIYRADVHKDVSFVLDLAGIRKIRKGAFDNEN